jgi:hypothetical protein
MDPKKSSSKGQKKIRNQNVLEALKDIGSNTTQSFQRDLLQGASKDFLRQMLGVNSAPRKVSGEIMPGESMEVDKAYSGEHQKMIQERRQLSFLNKLKEEELMMVREKSGQLKAQLNALQHELLNLTQATHGLAKETQVAAMSAPVEPGIYHIGYFQWLIEYVKGFTAKINNAALWMQEGNKRAQKKNYWAKYKKHGSKFLLSADHYLTRSAG